MDSRTHIKSYFIAKLLGNEIFIAHFHSLQIVKITKRLFSDNFSNLLKSTSIVGWLENESIKAWNTNLRGFGKAVAMRPSKPHDFQLSSEFCFLQRKREGNLENCALVTSLHCLSGDKRNLNEI